MNRKNDHYQEDPYDVIRRLRTMLETQKGQLEEYEFVCNSLMAEKAAAVRQATELKNKVEFLTDRIQQQQQQMKASQQTRGTPGVLVQGQPLAKQNRLFLSSFTPLLCKNDIVSSHIIPHSPGNSKTPRLLQSKEFVPSEITFQKKQVKSNLKNTVSVESSSENIAEKVGEFFIQDVMVISPDLLELKKMRQKNKQAKEFTFRQYYHFNFNPLYKNTKAEYLREIAKRAFPLGTTAVRTPIQTYHQFRAALQFKTEGKMGEEYFILNLKGDFVDVAKPKSFLGNCNPYQGLFGVCLRVPDFIPIRDDKNMKKKEQDVWMVDKIYAILTYFPFFNIHLSVLARIHNLLQPNWQKLQQEEILAQNLQRNLTQIQNSTQINQLITHLMQHKPEFKMPIFRDNYYFGSIPDAVNCQYAIASFACPIFFSIFAYEEMLLLLTALFLEKTLIFVSKSESAATLCGLFLTTVIHPFRYNQRLILNCDRQKIDNIVFEFPFILVASIKKDNSFGNVLKMFIDSNCDRFKGFNTKDQSGPLVMVDIDSNTILYDPLLNKTFEELIFSPSQALRDAYMTVNPSNSKSFTFPRKMPVQVTGRPRNDYEKNEEQRRKLQKECQHKIDNNLSKWPTYNLQAEHRLVLSLLTDFIRSLGISSEFQYQLIHNHSHSNRVKVARKHLHQKHPYHPRYIDVLTESQLFADYLDQLDKTLTS